MSAAMIFHCDRCHEHIPLGVDGNPTHRRLVEAAGPWHQRTIDLCENCAGAFDALMGGGR